MKKIKFNSILDSMRYAKEPKAFERFNEEIDENLKKLLTTVEKNSSLVKTPQEILENYQERIKKIIKDLSLNNPFIPQTTFLKEIEKYCVNNANDKVIKKEEQSSKLFEELINISFFSYENLSKLISSRNTVVKTNALNYYVTSRRYFQVLILNKFAIVNKKGFQYFSLLISWLEGEYDKVISELKSTQDCEYFEGRLKGLYRLLTECFLMVEQKDSKLGMNVFSEYRFGCVKSGTVKTTNYLKQISALFELAEVCKQASHKETYKNIREFCYSASNFDLLLELRQCNLPVEHFIKDSVADLHRLYQPILDNLYTLSTVSTHTEKHFRYLKPEVRVDLNFVSFARNILTYVKDRCREL